MASVQDSFGYALKRVSFFSVTLPHKSDQRNAALCRRYSRQGDTVLLFGAEHNTGVETAISRGRKVEAFVASPEARAKVEARTEIAFKLAYAQGIFQVRTG